MAKVNLIIAEVLDITCMRNDTFKLDMDWEDADDTAIDLTAYTFKMQVRKKSDSTSALLTFSDSEFTTKDSSGNLTLVKAASLMTIKAGNYRYDLQATHTDGTVSTWLNGLFIVKDDVTE